MAKLTKKAKALASFDRLKLHGIDEAIALAKSNATSKFDETIEVALALGVDPRHADQQPRHDHHDRGRDDTGGARVAELGGEQHEQRAEALAAGLDQVA